MTKWQYTIATYAGGPIEALGSMPEGFTDLPTETTEFAPFFYDAGQRGWEFCGAVPSPGEQQTDLTFIFKRPLE